MGQIDNAVNLYLYNVAIFIIPPFFACTFNGTGAEIDDDILEVIVEVKPTNVGEGGRSNGENENQGEDKSENLLHWFSPP